MCFHIPADLAYSLLGLRPLKVTGLDPCKQAIAMRRMLRRTAYGNVSTLPGASPVTDPHDQPGAYKCKPMDPLEPFRYHERLQRGEIRVMNVLAREFGEPMKCRLPIEPLDYVAYEALSYTWVDGTLCEHIWIEDKR